jgi:carbamate kinase
MPTKKPLVVIALGGHAFLRHGYAATMEEHERAARLISDILMDLVDKEYNIIVTHGNGPQVGNLLIQNEMSQDSVPMQPLDVLVAMTEGSLGYIMQQALLNELAKRKIKRYVVTVITQVIVDENDAAFKLPTKPIGPFFTEEEAKTREEELGWNVTEDSGRGWRRIVASPKPLRVIQRHMIKDAAYQGHIVIAGGGGGIPVVETSDEHGDAKYVGIEAVIDKDLTSALLASQVDADLLLILTDVEKVYLNYNTPEQRGLGALTIEMTTKFIKEGHFAKGSMEPKIQAILNFLNAGGKRALITSPSKLKDALSGMSGTHFVGRI